VPSRFASALLALAVLAAAGHAEAQRRGRGRLVIETSVEGAEVLVDEEVIGVTPLADPIELEPGSHTVRVRRPGYTEFTDVVRVRAGQRIALPVDLMALSMVLTVRTTPDEARVFVDGTFRGTSPIELELTEGRHRIRITHPTHREVTRQITAAPGQTEAIDVELEELSASELAPARAPEWYDDPLVWVAVGGGAVVLAVAIVIIAVVTQGGLQIDAYCGGAGEMNCIRVVPDW
jgi:hypothetical protein